MSFLGSIKEKSRIDDKSGSTATSFHINPAKSHQKSKSNLSSNISHQSISHRDQNSKKAALPKVVLPSMKQLKRSPEHTKNTSCAEVDKLEKSAKDAIEEIGGQNFIEDLLNQSFNEKEVANLNFWEFDHINDDSDSNHSESNASHVSMVNSKKAEVESINFQGQEHHKIKRLAMKGKNQLKSFSDQNDEGKNLNYLELAIILLQNINFSKRKFNFNLFKSANRRETLLISKKSVDDLIGNKINNIKDSHEILGLSDNILKNLNFHLQGDIENFTKPDQYREIIREKKKKEMKYRAE